MVTQLLIMIQLIFNNTSNHKYKPYWIQNFGRTSEAEVFDKALLG